MLKRKTLPQLGEPTIKVEEIDAGAGTEMTAFIAAAIREKAEREACGVGDKWQNAQPTIPPAFDAALVGKQLEVRYKYDLPVSAGGGHAFQLSLVPVQDPTGDPLCIRTHSRS